MGHPLKIAPDGPVIVIGAVNMDLSGTPAAALRDGDSNPGRVTMTPGGVARNIAENLARLGRKVSLITAMGDDLYAAFIRERSLNSGIDLSLSLTFPYARTSTYLCVNESNGDLHTAVSDMAICDLITPEKLSPLLGQINKASLVLADANLPEETLLFLAEKTEVSLAADPVSAAKAARLKGILPRLVLMKPNVAEAEILTGMQVRQDGDLRRLSDALHAMGVERVYISLGERGVWADDGRESELISCFPGTVRNTTGCGDAFVAAAADAWLRGLGTLDAARRALAAAAICAADTSAVSPALTAEAVELMMSSRLN